MSKSLEDSKNEVLAELKESTKLSDADFEKFAKSADTLVDLVTSTRNEAGARRIELRELQEKFNAEATKFEGEKKSLNEAKEQELSALKKQLEDKDKEFEPVKEKAKKYEAYDAEKRTAIKEALKDKWLTSFETIPLFDLEKIYNNILPDSKLIDSDNGKGKKPSPKEFYSLDELKRLTEKELADKETLAKAQRSMEFHMQKK